MLAKFKTLNQGIINLTGLWNTYILYLNMEEGELIKRDETVFETKQRKNSFSRMIIRLLLKC